MSERIVKEFSYTWSINEFRQHREGQHVSSPIFVMGDKDPQAWKIHVTIINNNLYLFLELQADTLEKAAYLIISLVDKEGKENVYVSKFIKEGAFEVRKFERFIRRDDILDEVNGLLPNGHLTILCKMYFEDDIVNARDLTVRNTSSINDDFEQLFENNKFSDVKLVVRGQEFRVHKAILTARSPVFSAMFEHEMRENNENLVEIVDIEPDVMQEVLRYIYAGRVKHVQDIKGDLLAAANKYGIDELKAVCEEKLINDLNVDTVGELLILADCHEAGNLKYSAIEFLAKHIKEIVNNENFKKSIKNMSSFFLDILQALAMKL